MKKISLIIPLMIGLSGCTTFSNAKPQSVTYPDTLFVCLDRPDPNNIQTDNDLGEFIIRQDTVITICKEKLKNVGELIRSNQPK